MRIALNELPGRTVLDANGRVLGKVRVPMVDMETWVVDTLRINVAKAAAGELGMMWSFFRRPTLDVPTGLIHAAGDAIILRVSLGELHDAMPVARPEDGADAGAASMSMH